MAKKYTPIKLDKTRNFRLGPQATYDFKAVSGKSVDKIGKDGFDVLEIAQLLYAGCKHEDHTLTVDKMMSILDEFELEELGSIMAQISPNDDGDVDPNAR
jgi:hypothetical protein